MSKRFKEKGKASISYVSGDDPERSFGNVSLALSDFLSVAGHSKKDMNIIIVMNAIQEIKQAGNREGQEEEMIATYEEYFEGDKWDKNKIASVLRMERTETNERKMILA
eukprot:975461_1